MTPRQILERLNAEFPNRHVSFNLEVTSFRDNTIYTEAGDPTNFDMFLYDYEHKRIDCATLERTSCCARRKDS